MENLSKVLASGTRAAGPLDAVTQLPEDWRLAHAAHEQLLKMGPPRVNVLLIGVDRVTRTVLKALLPDLREPIAVWTSGNDLVLPPMNQAQTLILQEVGTLPADDQLRLLDWLPRTAGRLQVVSTSSTALLPRVQSGTFVDMLYYRLNMVCIDMTA